MEGFVRKIESLAERKQYDEMKNLLEDVDNGPCIYRYCSEHLSHVKILRNICIDGRYDILQLFVKNNADIHQISKTEGSLLEIASKHGHAMIVAYLLDQGVELSQNAASPESPFYLASLYGHKEVLQILKYHSPRAYKDVEVRSTLLYAACLGGNINIAELWLSPEMNINQPAHYVTNFSEITTPLFAACKGRQFEMANYLISIGAVLTKEVVQAFPEMTAQLIDQKFHEYYDEATDSGNRSDTARSSTGSIPCLQHIGKFSSSYFEYIHDSWFCTYLYSLVELDLHDNCLKELPESVPWGFPNLRKFDVHENKLQKFLSPVDKDHIECHRIEEINLASNDLNEITTELFNLMSLKILILKDNKLEYLIKIHHALHDWQALNDRSPGDTSTRIFDLQCVSLQYFDISHNNLKLLPDKIRDLTGLVYLDVSHNKLSGFCDPWECPLRTLNLSHNQLERFTTSSEQYWSSYLLSLRLQYNQLDTMNESIVKLCSLRELNLSHNNIEYLPPPDLWKCNRLEVLDLSFNSLSNTATDQGVSQRGPKFINKLVKKIPQKNCRQPEFPSSLKRLYDLNLNSNYLKRVPESVCNLLNLGHLDIGNNEMKSLPKELGRLQGCVDLGLEGMDLSNIKPILNEDTLSPDIISFLRQELLECKPCYKLKLVVMGPKGVGKSALANALMEKEHLHTDVMVNRRDWVISPGKYKFKKRTRKDPEINASIWDLSGDKGFTVAQKAFLTPKSIILLVWNLKTDTHGISDLSQWIITIEAHAPSSPVILVGTHLDQFEKSSQKEITLQFHNQITRILEGRENKHSFCSFSLQDVSCLTKEGIGELREVIYSTALNTMSGGKIHKVLVPKSYLQLDEEFKKLRETKLLNKEPPILKLDELNLVIEKIKPLDTELSGRELNKAVQFLTEIGVVLHYEDPIHSLNQFYFLDPCWLGDLFHQVLWTCSITGIAKKGKIEIKSLEKMFDKNPKFPTEYFHQYIQIVERFDIALQIDNGKNLFVPSKLPEDCPGLQVQDFENSRKIHRLYKMSHIPNGFWSHLVSRILISMERVVQKAWYFGSHGRSSSGLNKTFAAKGSFSGSSSVRHGFQLNKRLLVYWREGIYVCHDNGYFLVEGRNLCNEDEQSDLEFGILITVLSTNEDFSLLGLIVDVIDDILKGCYFDIMALDEQGRLMEIYAVCPGCYTISDSLPLPFVDHFAAEKCAGLLQNNKYISCPKKRGTIPLKELVPELLLTELPEKFKLDGDKLMRGKMLGEGASGTVYFGKYDDVQVAVKVYHASSKHVAFSSTDSGSDTMGSTAAMEDYYNIGDFRPSEDESDNLKALKAFTEMRQEVIMISRLQHPCVVAMIGLCIQPVLSVVLELAPLGNLRSVIKSRLENVTRISNKLLKPVFGKNLTFKIVFQFAKAIEYIHGSGIINRDLKPDNILVFSLDCDDVVNIKLSDYGISKFGVSQGTAGFVGTPAYQAPEILADLVYDEKVDIASFGLITSEVLSGYPPYSEHENLAQITKAVLDEKKKPCMKDHNIETRFPRLERLMDECTEFDPSERPSALKIAKTMGKVQFLCEHSIIKNPDDVPHNIPHVVSGITQHDSKSKYFWMWETVRDAQSLGEYRAYSIMDSKTCQHNVYKHRMDGPTVTCICQVGSSIWVGNVAKQIEILGTQLVGFPNRKGLLPVDSVPTNIAAVCDDPKKECIGMQGAFVSFGNGSISLMGPVVKTVLNRTNVSKSIPMVCSWQEMKRLEISKKPIKGLNYFKDTKELWAGCGNEVVVIDSEKLFVKIRISLAPDGYNTVVHCLRPFAGTVFCVMENSSTFYQIDMETYKMKYVFNCVFTEKKSFHPVIAKAVENNDKKSGTAKTDGSQQFQQGDNDGEKKNENQQSGNVRRDYNLSNMDKEATIPKEYEMYSHMQEDEDVINTTSEASSPMERHTAPPPIPARSPIIYQDIQEKPFNAESYDSQSTHMSHKNVFQQSSSDIPPVPPRMHPGGNKEPHQTSVDDSDIYRGPKTRPSFQVECRSTPSRYENVALVTDTKKNASTLPPNFKWSLSGEDIIVTCVCIVNDTLWIGRSCGDILIISLNEGSSNNVEYGKVIATLRNFSSDEESCDGAIIEIIKTGNVVTSFQATNELTCELKIWEAYTVQDIIKIRNFWSLLKSQNCHQQGT